MEITVFGVLIVMYICITVYMFFNLLFDGEDIDIALIVSLFWPVLIIATAVLFGKK